MSERRFNPQEWVAPIIAIGTWLFCMLQAYRGIHYVPDEWMLAIILSPYGGCLYEQVRDKLVLVLRRLPRLPKKD